MTAEIEKLRAEVERLERELEANHFGGLFDTKNRDHRLKKLKKLRKQLAALESKPKKRARKSDDK